MCIVSVLHILASHRQVSAGSWPGHIFQRLLAPELLAIKIHLGRNITQKSGTQVTHPIILYFYLFNKYAPNTYYVPGFVRSLAKDSELLFRLEKGWIKPRNWRAAIPKGTNRLWREQGIRMDSLGLRKRL